MPMNTNVGQLCVGRMGSELKFFIKSFQQIQAGLDESSRLSLLSSKMDKDCTFNLVNLVNTFNEINQ